MVVSGDAIRVLNYVDDIAATLRRILANMPSISDEEKKRVADYMRKAEPNYVNVIERLEKGQ